MQRQKISLQYQKVKLCENLDIVSSRITSLCSFMDNFLGRLKNILASEFSGTAINDILDRLNNAINLDYLEAEIEKMERKQARRQQRSKSYYRSPPPPKSNAKYKEYYDALEVSPGASFEEIKKSYRRLIKIYHPDRYANDPEKRKVAQAISLKLNEAYSYFEERKK